MAVSGPVLLAGADPLVAGTVLAVFQLFFFMLFYNVVYPENVKLILGCFGMSVFNFIPNPLEALEEGFPDLPAPNNFYVNEYTGFFIKTAGPPVMLGLFVGAFYFYGWFGGHLMR
jgi:hypothetical protein